MNDRGESVIFSSNGGFRNDVIQVVSEMNDVTILPIFWEQ